MRYTHLRQADLNLLPALQALVEERSVSRAAQRLAISQPAMSRVLDRLQQMFGDELLIRRGRGFEPTQRALQVRDEIERLLPRLDGLLRGGDFDPGTAAETYRIAAPDAALALFVPLLVERVAAAAPAARLDVQPLAEGASVEPLAANRADLAFSINHAPAPYRYEPLYEERPACLVRAGHALGEAAGVTLQRYLQQRHVSLSPSQQTEAIDRVLAEHGGSREVQVRLPGLVPAVWAVERSDLVLTLPGLLARHFTRLTRTVALPAPPELPASTCILVWHRRSDRDPAQNWLREQTRQAVGQRLAELGRTAAPVPAARAAHAVPHRPKAPDPTIDEP